MEHQHEHSNGNGQTRPSFFKSPVNVAIAMAAVIAAFFLLREHWYHVLGFWPYLLLLLCPLMHLFMGHGGHGGHGSETKGDPSGKND